MGQDGGDKYTPPESASPKGVITPGVETRGYNVIFEKLVADERDIVGQLAYCLYKQSKKLYLREFERLNNRCATEAEILNHVTCAEMPALSMYLEKAKWEFSIFFTLATGEREREVERNFQDQLWRLIKRHKPESFGERSWLFFKALMFGGFGGVVGNFLTTVIMLLLLFGAATSSSRDEFSKSAKESLISGLAEVIGVTVSIDRGAPD